jgi:hypothetical protein
MSNAWTYSILSAIDDELIEIQYRTHKIAKGNYEGWKDITGEELFTLQTRAENARKMLGPVMSDHRSSTESDLEDISKGGDR